MSEVPKSDLAVLGGVGKPWLGRLAGEWRSDNHTDRRSNEYAHVFNYILQQQHRSFWVRFTVDPFSAVAAGTCGADPK